MLAAETIFHWRMTGETRRLSDMLSTMLPPDNETVASLGGETGERYLEP